MTLKDHMRQYFEKYLAAYEKIGRLPRIEVSDEIDPAAYLSEADDEGYAVWQPLQKNEVTSLASIRETCGPLHESLNEYFNAYWFFVMGGKIGQHYIELFPVPLGNPLGDFKRYVQGYASVHRRPLTHAPIGVDANSGLLVVVDNRSGAIFLEDDERQQFVPLAPSLETLIERLTESL